MDTGQKSVVSKMCLRLPVFPLHPCREESKSLLTQHEICDLGCLKCGSLDLSVQMDLSLSSLAWPSPSTGRDEVRVVR